MVEEFGSPSSYIQGKGVLFESDKYLKTLVQSRYYWLAKQSIKL